MTLLDDAPHPPAGILDVDQVFASIVDHLRTASPDAALPRVQSFQRRLEAVETELLAARQRAGASESDCDDAAGRGATRSKSEASRRTKRAKTLNQNPALGADLHAGALTPEQLDAIAHAAERSDGDAAHDDSLIDRVKAANPDQAKRIARQWLDEHRDPDDLESEHERQRRLRKVSTFTTERGTKALFAEGDRVSIGQMAKAIDRLADRLYRSDGGRDVPAAAHTRTRDQRRFDALSALVSGETDRGCGTTRRTVILADTDGSNAEIIGTGPLPTSVLERLMCNADLVGAVFSTSGQPLWLGRRVRMVTPAQWLALVARDRGCVLCGTDPEYCEAHHLVPWQAAARGRSDIDNLALVCASCHHHIHDSGQTLYQNGDIGAWRLRPATPDETPPPRAKSPP